MGKLVSKTQFLKKLWSDEGKGYARCQKEGKYSREGGREQVRRRAKLCPQTEFQGCETCGAYILCAPALPSSTLSISTFSLGRLAFCLRTALNLFETSPPRA